MNFNIYQKGIRVIWTAFLLTSGLLAANVWAIHFSGVFPRDKGCSVIYGSLSVGFGGRDFLIEDCDSSSRLLQSFESIGHIKHLQFITENTAWGIVGGSIVKFDFQNDEVMFEVVKRENDELRLESIFFLDNRNGWVSGRNGMILRTVDGGQTWASVKTNTKADIIDLGFVDREFGWATVTSNDLEKFSGAYLATRDGGQTWNSIPMPMNTSLSPLTFTSRDHACGVKSRNEIMCTFNGNNWITAKLDPENRGGFHFVDSKLGWHVGSSIMRTKDGGRTWQYVLQDKDERNRAFSGLNLDGVVFESKKSGWAWVTKSVLKTIDGGETWADVSSVLKQVLKD